MIFLEQYILDLMNDRRHGPLAQMAKLGLLISSYIYGFLVRCHHFFYKVNLLKSYKAPVAVVNVGNITLGGTGKTPFVIMLSRHITQKNLFPSGTGTRPGREFKVGVLIRGYGEDEWRMLEDRLGKYGVKIFVGRDRVRSAREALGYGINNLVLDDGFQHRRLRRDLDIVLFDSTNPFGNKHLFPRGILREPLVSLRRADIVVLTKVDKGKGNISTIENEIKRIAPSKAIIKTVHKPKNLIDIKTRSVKELISINDKMVCIFSAICDPSYFRYTVDGTGACVGLEFIFPDHYSYKGRDLERIFKECEKKNIDTVITTEKDAVKLKRLTLPGSTPQILALGIELEITEGEEELDAGLHRLHMRYSG